MYIIVLMANIINLKQLISYLFLGSLNTAVGFFLYLIITYHGLNPKIALTFVYIIGIFFGCFAYKKYTFSYKGTSANIFLRYLTSYLLGYILNFIILFIFVDKLSYQHQWVQFSATIFVAAFNFFLLKYCVFK